VSEISLLESKFPHQYDFNDIQFDYKGVLRRVILTETQNFFQSRYKRNLSQFKTDTIFNHSAGLSAQLELRSTNNQSMTSKNAGGSMEAGQLIHQVVEKLGYRPELASQLAN